MRFPYKLHSDLMVGSIIPIPETNPPAPVKAVGDGLTGAGAEGHQLNAKGGFINFVIPPEALDTIREHAASVGWRVSSFHRVTQPMDWAGVSICRASLGWFLVPPAE